MSDDAPAAPAPAAADEPMQSATVQAAPAAAAAGAAAGADAAPEDPVTSAVLGCAGVAGVRSVSDDYDALRVRVAVRYGTPIAALGDEVGAALSGLLAGRTLRLDVVDVTA